MEDIELARSLLEEENLNLIIVNGGRVLFSSKDSGVAPLFRAIQSMGKSLYNAGNGGNLDLGLNMLRWLTG